MNLNSDKTRISIYEIEIIKNAIGKAQYIIVEVEMLDGSFCGRAKVCFTPEELERLKDWLQSLPQQKLMSFQLNSLWAVFEKTHFDLQIYPQQNDQYDLLVYVSLSKLKWVNGRYIPYYFKFIFEAQPDQLNIQIA